MPALLPSYAERLQYPNERDDSVLESSKLAEEEASSNLVEDLGSKEQSTTSVKSSDAAGDSSSLELSAAIPLTLGLSVLLLFVVLVLVRCFNWYRYSSLSKNRFKRFFKDPNDYLVEGMYL